MVEAEEVSVIVITSPALKLPLKLLPSMKLPEKLPIELQPLFIGRGITVMIRLAAWAKSANIIAAPATPKIILSFVKAPTPLFRKSYALGATDFNSKQLKLKQINEFYPLLGRVFRYLRLKSPIR